MAKANLKLPDGTTVTIEGTPEEVSRTIQRISSGEAGDSSGSQRQRTPSSRRKVKSQAPKPKPSGPIDYIRELIADDFFSGRRALGEVRTELEARGHIYPVTSLSPAILRLVRKRELRRMPEGNHWRYVNP
ncbi:MAG: hypothetical protein ACREA0_19260 [bacterium]